MEAKEDEKKEMGFMDHLEELRRRLFFALIGILVGGVAIFVSKDWVFDRLIFGPRNPDFITFRAWCALSHFTGAGDRLCVTDIKYELINTTMLGNFSAHILVSAIGGFILAFPLIFGQFWRFIRPGLHGSEASAVRGVTWAASGLFFCGVAFGYFVIAPLSLQFLGHYEIGDVQARIALMSYLKNRGEHHAGCRHHLSGSRHHPLLGQDASGDASRIEEVPEAHLGRHAHCSGHHYPPRLDQSSVGGHARSWALRDWHFASQTHPAQTKCRGRSTKRYCNMKLTAQNIVKQYGRRKVVNEVGFEVRTGEVVGLLGPNGAGKTTSFYMVTGLVQPDGGRVTLEDEHGQEHDITREPMYKRAQRGIGYLPQEASVFSQTQCGGQHHGCVGTAPKGPQGTKSAARISPRRVRPNPSQKKQRGCVEWR